MAENSESAQQSLNKYLDSLSKKKARVAMAVRLGDGTPISSSYMEFDRAEDACRFYDDAMQMWPKYRDACDHATEQR